MFDMRFPKVTFMIANTADTAIHRPETHQTSSSPTSRQSLSKTVLNTTMPLRTAEPPRPITKCNGFFTKYNILSRSFHQALAQRAVKQTHCVHKALPSTIKSTLQERCLNIIDTTEPPHTHHLTYTPYSNITKDHNRQDSYSTCL
jgi:hypothetical protein